MKRRWIWSVLVVAVLAGGFYAARVSVVTAFQNDACLVISYAVAEKVEEGADVSPQAVSAIVTRLIEASVIQAKLDAEGRPTDYNGNPFHIEIREGSVVTSTRRSILYPFEARASVEIDG